MAEPIFISELIQRVLSGNIRIPSFQRGFVWDADRVAHLMDSIYKGFPFGNLLFWRTKTPLKTERKLGPYHLPPNDPDYPIDYILDGQQRATSIFGVFQSGLDPEPDEDDSIFKIYFDLTQDSTVQDSNFIYVPDSEVDRDRHFPLRLLFNPPEYRRYTREMPESIAGAVDTLYSRFTQARLPVQAFMTDDRTAVAIVFERINRLGVELDTLQLLSAWTWSEDFDLQEQFEDLAEELAPYGFKDVGEDSDLLLRCCSAIIKGDASPKTIISLNGEEVRQRFAEIRKGIHGAIDFLRSEFKAYSAAVLPFPTIIIPLCAFFATSSEQDTAPTACQRVILKRWIWRTFFSRRYSKRLEQLNEDVREVLSLRSGLSHSLGDFAVDLKSDFFSQSPFNLNTVNTKAFILLLADRCPLSFISGAPVDLGPVLRECNKREFHHIFPKKMLSGLSVEAKKINTLTNFAILNRAENNKIGGLPPSQYKSKMPSNQESLRLILRSAFCPDEMFTDDFSKFESIRASMLVARSYELMDLNEAHQR